MNRKDFIERMMALCLFPAVPALANGKMENVLAPTTEEDGKEYLSKWKKGYLDIHQISTGKGNAAFLIFPDGTTMLIDAGDLGVYGGKQEIMKQVPDDSKTPAEWIITYIKHFSAPLKNDAALDYALITHYDTDHIGQCGELSKEKKGANYKLTGITHVGDQLNIKTLIDRGYPDYNYPSVERFAGDDRQNYISYVKSRDAEGKRNESFEVGSNSQIKLLKKPSKYPTFEVRNVIGNGVVWTGKGSETKYLVPSDIPSNKQLNENRCSCGVRIKYGNFDYLSCGDIQGSKGWDDMETPVGKAVGEMDVVVCNHHAYSDAMFDGYVSLIKPRVFIIPVWDFYHPQPETLARMLSQSNYQGERDIYAAGLVHSNRIRLSDDGQKIKPDGHVVTRVYPGGDKYQIFVLNNKSTDYEIIYKSDVIQSKKK